MKHINYLSIVACILTIGTISCSDESELPEKNTTDGKLKMEFSLSHPGATKATETSFEKDDIVGVFVTDANSPLEIAGNVVNNRKLQFDGTTWTSSQPLYWNPGTYNAFAYYPYRDEISSISDLEFEVSADQRDLSGVSSGYEASDFLYSNAKGIVASSNPIALQFRHIMSKLTVRLIKGEDFEGDFPETGTVYIHNTVLKSTIDLEVGIATKDSRATGKTIAARQISPSTYSAIIVPQRLENKVPLIEVIMNGVSYLFESRFLFKPGVHHIVNLVVDSNPEKIKIEIGGEITNWN